MVLLSSIAVAAFLVGEGKAPPAGTAAAGPKPLLPSADLSGISLVELRRHLGRLDCVTGLQGGEDCLVELAAVDLQRGMPADEGGRVTVFVRAVEGRVGQLIINGPASRLEPVIGQLASYYGTSGKDASRTSPGHAACRRLAEWDRARQSAVVRSCDRSATGDGAFLIIDMLADWYAHTGSRD